MSKTHKVRKVNNFFSFPNHKCFQFLFGRNAKIFSFESKVLVLSLKKKMANYSLPTCDLLEKTLTYLWFKN